MKDWDKEKTITEQGYDPENIALLHYKQSNCLLITYNTSEHMNIVYIIRHIASIIIATLIYTVHNNNNNNNYYYYYVY